MRNPHIRGIRRIQKDESLHKRAKIHKANWFYTTSRVWKGGSMNECDHFRQLEEAADDGLPVEMDDYDIECLYNSIYPEEVKEWMTSMI